MAAFGLKIFVSGVDFLRVLHLLDTTEDYAGTEIHLTTLVKAQISQGINTQIACTKGGLLHQAVAAQSLPFVLLPSDNHWQMVRSMRAMTHNKYDVVHAHNGRTRLLAAFGVKDPIAVVATQHFIMTQSEMYRGLKKQLANQAHRQVNRRVSHFIAISHAAHDAMVKREGIRSSQITVVPNGIESLRKPDSAQKMQMRQELGIVDGAFLIVCVARLRVEKGLHFLVDAMANVVAMHPKTRLIVAGDGGLQRELENQVAKLKLEASIDFLGYRDDATDLIGIADLFVLPSPAEPFGLVLLEAMAQSVPAIATRAGGPMEIIEDGISGQLVEPSNSQDLSSAILELLSNSEKRDFLGHNAFQRFNKHFTAERMAKATIEVYQRAAKS